MKCPYCGAEDTRVIDSRPADDGASIRRRRHCDECEKRFTTYEKVETIPVMIVKKDLTREEYNRAKIEAGIIRSCHKLPISAEQISDLVDDIEKEIFSMDAKEIESKVIGGILIEKLKELDPVAYVRFASIYKEFKDVNTFMEEIKTFLDNK